MPPRWPRKRLTEMLAIDYPIVQGRLGGLSSQRLTAAVSSSGGPGSFGAHSLSPDAISGVIGAIRALKLPIAWRRARAGKASTISTSSSQTPIPIH